MPELEPIEAPDDGSCDRGLKYIPDHVRRMLDLWMSQWRHTHTGIALMTAIGNAVQAVEDENFDVWLSTQLAVATGHALEQWGALVGEPKGVLDDDDYRVFIEARILANTSTGAPDELYEIVKRITAPSEVGIIRTPPQGYEVIIRRADYMSDARARRVGRMIRSIKPAGISTYIVEYADGYFGFAGDDDAASLDLGELARNL